MFYGHTVIKKQRNYPAIKTFFAFTSALLLSAATYAGTPKCEKAFVHFKGGSQQDGLYATKAFKAKILPAKELDSLVVEYQQTNNNTKKKELVEKAFLSTVGLLGRVANRWHSRNPHMDYTDLFQHGALAIFSAMKKFNPRKAKFSTYVVTWYSAYIIRHVVDELLLHRKDVNRPVLVEYFMNSGRIHQRLAKKNEKPTAANLARELYVYQIETKRKSPVKPTAYDIEQAQLSIVDFRNPISTSAPSPLPEGELNDYLVSVIESRIAEGHPLGDAFDSATPEEVASSKETANKIGALLEEFRLTLKSEREQKIFDQRIMQAREDQVSAVEIAHQMNPQVSRQAIQSAEKRILTQLKAFLESKNARELIDND